MADLQNPTAVAPPVAAPVPVAPVAPMNAGALIPKKNPYTTTSDKIVAFQDAVDSGNKNTFVELSKDPDPVISSAAKEKMAVIETHEPLAKHVASIDVSKPEGRIAIEQTFNTVNKRDEAKAKGWTTAADNPQVGQALFRYLLGDKDGAIMQITGGKVKAETKFDDNGNMLVVNTNELGQIDSVFDVKQKRLISRDEYADRGGSHELENTMYRKNMVENAKLYREKWLKDTEDYNKSLGALDLAAMKSSQMEELAKNFKDLTADQQMKVSSFASGTLGYKQAQNTMTQILNQAGTSAGQKLSMEDGKAVAAALGIMAGVKANYTEDGKFVVSGGETYDVNSMKQWLKSTNHSENMEKNYTQTSENLKRVYRQAAEGFDENGKPLNMTPAQQGEYVRKLAALDQYFSLAKERDDIYNKSRDRIPSFVALPTALPNIADQTSRLRLNALQGQYSGEQMKGFSAFADRMYKFEKEKNPNFIPEPGRYEAQWVKQPEYQEMRDKYRQRTREILAEMPKITPSTTTASEVGGITVNQQQGVKPVELPNTVDTKTAEKPKVKGVSPPAKTSAPPPKFRIVTPGVSPTGVPSR
jgi:hypothetical protein